MMEPILCTTHLKYVSSSDDVFCDAMAKKKIPSEILSEPRSAKAKGNGFTSV